MIELNKIYCEDCLETMSRMPDNFVDSIVTDPPYGLEFMGKEWDAPWKDGKASKEFNTSCEGKLGGFKKLPNHSRVNNLKCLNCGKWKFSSNPCKCENPIFPNARLLAMKSLQNWCEQWAKECLRVLKPGGYLLSFGGTRTYHRMACAIEDAGFEIRDQIQWLYGSGFPKSLDINKAIDKKAEENIEIIKAKKELGQWEGWGTALKPANEPICLARKPLSEKTVAENVLKWGTGGINIDECRIVTNDKLNGGATTGSVSASEGWDRPWRHNEEYIKAKSNRAKKQVVKGELLGRWPANVIHDGSEEVLREFPNTCSGGWQTGSKINSKTTFWGSGELHQEGRIIDNGGSAARFFYCAKASKAERDAKCEGIELKDPIYGKNMSSSDKGTISNSINPQRNNHPTVKPIALMRYLCRLITPPKGIVYDPFIGSGTTGIAAGLEDFNFIGSEIEKDSCRIAEKRIAFHRAQLKLQYE